MTSLRSAGSCFNASCEAAPAPSVLWGDFGANGCPWGAVVCPGAVRGSACVMGPIPSVCQELDGICSASYSPCRSVAGPLLTKLSASIPAASAPGQLREESTTELLMVTHQATPKYQLIMLGRVAALGFLPMQDSPPAPSAGVATSCRKSVASCVASLSQVQLVGPFRR
jgi:hypothetical protein